MHTIRQVLPLLLVFFGPLSPLHASPATTHNTGMDAVAPPLHSASNDYVVFGVRESSRQSDLNGDGDQDDIVVHYFDVQDQTIVNLQFAGVGNVCGPLIAISVGERNQGVDLNEDGDMSDVVLHVHDPILGTTENQKIALLTGSLTHSDALIAVLVRESFQGGADLNGDGDAQDTVPHIYDVPSRTLRNSMLAASISSASAAGVGLLVGEGTQSADLNGDGDAFDFVVHVYDAATSSFRNLAIPGTPPVISSNILAFLAAESDHATDFNSDGDMNDQVAHIYEFPSQSLFNLELAASDPPLVSTGVAVIAVSEGSQGADLNEDGDTRDTVPHLFGVDDMRLINLGFSSRMNSLFGLSENLLAMSVREAELQSDLNGDLDVADTVAFYYEIGSDQLTNTGHALADANDLPMASQALGAFTVSERNQGFTDLNGDGDFSDQVAFVFDPDRGRTTNLAYAVSGTSSHFELNGSSLAFRASESGEGRDLNGDGDMEDSVLHSYVSSGGIPLNLRLATQLTVSTGDLLAYQVIESSQNVDLTGDGDLSDKVLHVTTLSANQPYGAGTVNNSTGMAVDVLRINGSTGTVTVGLGSAIELSMSNSPAGPLSAKYLLWVWSGRPGAPSPLETPQTTLGCTVNPTPINPELGPQPFLCMRSPTIPALACQGIQQRSGPPLSPFTVSKSSGLSAPTTLTIQGVVRDHGATNPSLFSVTNAVLLRVF